MKPEKEREPLLHDLIDFPAHLLILRGIGSSAALDHLQAALKEKGENYQPWYIPGPTPYEGLGFLTDPALEVTPLELGKAPYSIGPRQYLPMFGGIEITLSDDRKLVVVNARLPDTDEQYERRRNEARLLAQQLNSLLTNDALVLLSLQSRETLDSPMTRQLTDLPLKWIRPVDQDGDSWVYRDPEGLDYRNDQWLFVSPSLKEFMLYEGEIRDTAYLRAAGPYRHQLLQIH